MTEREKVIKGPEHCIGDNCYGDKWSECKYSGHGCIDALLEDALALLKAQEPHIMTLSEVRNLKESTPVWLEDVDKKDVIGALFMRDYSGTKCVDFAIVRDWEVECVVADYMDYGVRWRCWTSRPTDEQREAIPWN